MGSNNSKRNQMKKIELTKKCYDYLNDNFPKFSPKNKLNIALEITKKNMTNRHEHSGSLTINVL